MGSLKSKIIRGDSTHDLEDKLNLFLENITSDQIVRLEYVVGGSGNSSYHYYSVLLLYNEIVDLNTHYKESE